MRNKEFRGESWKKVNITKLAKVARRAEAVDPDGGIGR